MKTFSILFFTLVLAYNLKAQLPGEIQNELQTNYGIYGGLNLNYNSPSFSPYPSINNLSFTSKKTTANGDFGIIGNFPVSNMVVISGRIGYNGLSATINQAAGNNSYSFQTSLNYLEITPAVQLHNLIWNQHFYVMGGLEFGIPVSKTYTLTNTTTNSTVANAATIPNANTRFDLALGLGYNVPLSRSLNLIPEVSYRIPFINASNNANFKSWNIPQLRAGIALTFNPGAEEQQMKMAEAPAPPVENKFDVSMSVRGLDNNGHPEALKNLTIDETRYEELHPFLSYVFFDEGKAEPLKNSQMMESETTAGKFMISQLPSNSLDINQRTLDIVGTRLQQYNTAVLTITGCNDGRREMGMKDLSMQRANFAKVYLMNHYNIPEKRLVVNYRDLPENPSNPKEADGVVENRRVEFSCTIPNVLDPVDTKDSTARLSTPNVVEFMPDIVSTKPIKSWDLSIYQGGEQIGNMAGTENTHSIMWSIQPNSIRKSELPVEWTFHVNNSDGTSKQVNGSIPVDYYTAERMNQQKMPDRMVNKFSLILFDFDKADITPENARIINTMILPVIKNNSTVNITGYTDRTGTAQHDMKLSQDRADSIKDALQQHVNCTYQTMGLGKTAMLYDNDSPAGRQLCRTVQITVETPITSMSAK